MGATSEHKPIKQKVRCKICPLLAHTPYLVEKFWSEFPIQIVRNSFTASGYFYENGIDYFGETESESDA